MNEQAFELLKQQLSARDGEVAFLKSQLASANEKLNDLNVKLANLERTNAELNQNIKEFSRQLAQLQGDDQRYDGYAGKRRRFIPGKHQTKLVQFGFGTANDDTNGMVVDNDSSPNLTSQIDLQTENVNSNDADNKANESNANDSDQNTANQQSGIIFKNNGRQAGSKSKPINVDVKPNGLMALTQLLKRTVGKGDYTIQFYPSESKAKINPANTDCSTIICKCLFDHGYQYYAYMDKSERKAAYILRGLYNVHSTDEVKDALVQAGLPSTIVVSEFTTGRMRANPDPHGRRLFKIIVEPDFEPKKLDNITGIFNLRIRFEAMKKSLVAQCHNCQEFFHTAATCSRNHRCVKCSENHPPGQCKRNNENGPPPSCVNCGGDHTANNWQACSYFTQKVVPRIENKLKNNEFAENSFAATLKKGLANNPSTSKNQQTTKQNKSTPTTSNNAQQTATNDPFATMAEALSLLANSMQFIRSNYQPASNSPRNRNGSKR